MTNTEHYHLSLLLPLALQSVVASLNLIVLILRRTTWLTLTALTSSDPAAAAAKNKALLTNCTLPALHLWTYIRQLDTNTTLFADMFLILT